MSDFYTRIKELRKKRNLLQREVADAIGVSLIQYKRYEAKKQQPTLNVIIKLADYYDVDANYLLGRSDDL